MNPVVLRAKMMMMTLAEVISNMFQYFTIEPDEIPDEITGKEREAISNFIETIYEVRIASEILKDAVSMEEEKNNRHG